MKFYQAGKPLAQQRHRMFRNIAYDPQSSIKKKINAEFTKQFQRQGYLKPVDGAISATVTILHPIPQSWSKKHKASVLTGMDNFVTSRTGDIDNICKLYFDVLNKLAYKDDAQIVSLFSQKRYSEIPGVEINLSKIEGDMINEHAITYKNEISIEDLNYLVKKANRLGLIA